MPLPLKLDSHQQLCCIITTFSKEGDAAHIVRTLIRERLIACGTLLDRARSIYIWKGQLEDKEEILAILKTTTEAASAAAARLQELHPYATPEILVLNPDSANPSYADWIAKNVLLK